MKTEDLKTEMENPTYVLLDFSLHLTLPGGSVMGSIDFRPLNVGSQQVIINALTKEHFIELLNSGKIKFVL